jgi:sugar lactone lactonase YvrE
LRRPARALVLEELEDRFCPSGSYLVVGSLNNNSVLRYSESTGAFVDQIDPQNLANLNQPGGGVFGPDGNLYVSSGIFLNNNNHKVLQYDGTTGAFQSVFASQNITSPRAVLFGRDGNLYVADGNDAASGDPASIERFDGKTGAFLNYFVAPSNNGGLEHPTDMVFGPDGTNDGKLDLYVAAGHQNVIYRYDGTTGAFKGVFVSAPSGGLRLPWGMVFGADGSLYVAYLTASALTSSNGPDFLPGAVLKFEGPSGPNPGAFLGTFVPSGSGGLANPSAILFGPDPSENGKTDLYVASSVQSGNRGNFIAEAHTSQVLRYDATTGAFLGTFVTPDSGGLRSPSFLTFTETDPTTLNYDGATTSATAGTPLAQPASSTPTSTASPMVAISGGSSLAADLTGPPPVSLFDPATAPLPLGNVQPSVAPAGATSPALPFSRPPLQTPSLTSNLPPADWLHRQWGEEKAAVDRFFTNLDTELSLALFADDLTLAGLSSAVRTPGEPRG